MQTTKDIYRVKEQLKMAVLQTLEQEGMDSYIGSIILEAVLNDIRKPVLLGEAMKDWQESMNEQLQSEGG